jgi:hypothetical protein
VHLMANEGLCVVEFHGPPTLRAEPSGYLLITQCSPAARPRD